ncbi:hypothetical protein RclHR1_04710007 [Rhizophagus clarus]|uniref:Uncharacterized protein n=1 Tax=Rhizophagus clarus TaxID=94130 RepID=A0A2Z6SCZ1_9GLOM|nr:hypothetical protein RclHR1_04710007 [Rhizophagus clarus]GES82216.1 hypothetical protein GLOIN_2v1779171 [Rhizophagus clarus]
MATPSHSPSVNENNEPVKGSALVRLYKPANIFPITFSLRHVCPSLSCDIRGAGTLFNTKKARYYLLSLSLFSTTNISTNYFSVFTNDTDLPGTHQQIFSSTSKSPNINFLIGNFLTFVFNLNRQFPSHVVTKYFSRLRVLLKEKLCSIRTRMDSDSSNNRHTKTYIRFANRDHVIYLGFYLRCKLECNLPATSVMSNKRWRCGEHYNEINVCHPSGHHVPRDAKYYADELKHRAKKKKGNPREVKHIYSNRLGISYDVVIKMYKDIPGRQRRKLPDSPKWKYFKEYKRLQFDILRSPQQIQRFNRLSTLVLSHNANAKYKRPFILGAQKNGMQPATVFKQLHHCPSKQMPSTGSTFNFVHNGFPLQAIRNKAKRLRCKYKWKIKLLPLPPNFAGDARAYYRTHYRIDLDIPSICERYRRDSLALAGIAHCDQIMSYIDTIKNVPQKTVQDVTLDHQHDRVYVISPEDTALLATPNIYLRRIHTSLTPLSDSALKRLRLSQAPSSSTAATSFTLGLLIQLVIQLIIKVWRKLEVC